MENQSVDKSEVVILVLGNNRVEANREKLARYSLYFASLFSENFKDYSQNEFTINYDISLSTLKYHLSGEPRKPCLVLSFKGITLMLDCGLNMQSVLNFMAMLMVPSARFNSLPLWFPRDNHQDWQIERLRKIFKKNHAGKSNFVHWINNEGDHTRVVHSPKYFFVVRASLEKFLTGHYSELLELLELSVVFMAEKLTDNIIEIIICMRLPPDNMLGIWLLAENLGLKVLRDVALASCLDRFEELPVSSLVELPIYNFFKLILNVNVRSTPARLLVVREEWRKNNASPKDLPDSFSQFLNSDPDNVRTLLEMKRQHFVQCVAGNKLNKSLAIYSWNGKILQELTEMTDSQMHTTFVDNGKEIIGRQVVGRGFNIYLIGGEQGLGSGRFNTALWRYCLFSKKWYIETFLPRPRRHMAVALLENKLYLFGGVGRHRLKLTSVDVFNIHTGIWSKAADVPEEFTEVPTSCVINNKFIYYKSFYYIYEPVLDTWTTFYPELRNTSLSDFSDLDLINMDYENTEREPQCLTRSIVGHRDKDSTNMPIVYVTDVKPDTKWAQLQKSIFLLPRREILSVIVHDWTYEDHSSTFDQQIINWPCLVSFGHSEGRAIVEVGELGYNDSLVPVENSNRLNKDTYRRLRAYNRDLNDVAPNCFKLRLGCFNLIDPESLHTRIPLPEQESISV